MNDKEVTKQLVIIGNGFDLHFGQKTSFKDYIENFSISSEIIKLEELFKELFLLGRKNISINQFNQQVENDGIDDIKNKIREIINYIDTIILKFSFNKKKVLTFYIQARCHQVEIEVIPEIKKNVYSAYSNVISKRINLFNEMIKKLREKVTTTERLNFWDIYFLFLRDRNKLKENSNWSDVEKRLLDFYDIDVYQDYSRKFTEYENIYRIIRSFGNTPLMWDRFQSKDFWLIIFTLIEDFGFPKVDIDNYLYSELVKFSKNFVAFLRDQFDSQRKDSEDRKISEFVDSIAMDNEKFELLNFNYTEVKSDNCVKQIHIHGSIKDLNVTPPIIGINVNDLNNNVKNNAFKMTKQYQLIVAPAGDKLDLTDINTIVFYGHSLALADYQYFKNIFDRVDLLKSSVKLIFKYSIFDPERKEEIQKDNYDSVYNLLKHYSDDTGVDVITTLILENRLKLQEI